MTKNEYTETKISELMRISARPITLIFIERLLSMRSIEVFL